MLFSIIFADGQHLTFYSLCTANSDNKLKNLNDGMQCYRVVILSMQILVFVFVFAFVFALVFAFAFVEQTNTAISFVLLRRDCDQRDCCNDTDARSETNPPIDEMGSY